MANGRKGTINRDPVNSEELEALTAQEEADVQRAQTAAAAGSSVGEIEEARAEAEGRAEAAERRADALAQEMAQLKEQMAALMRANTLLNRPAAQAVTEEMDGARGAEGQPVFDEDQPHGVIYGDTEVAYEQDGHQFGRNRAYLRTLPTKLRGCQRPFNPRLVGFVRPRPNQKAVDALDWVRGRDPT